MRNRWGVEIKKGHWVTGRGARGSVFEGRVVSVDSRSDFAKAYGAQVALDSGATVGADDISQTLGPMTVGKDGTVKQNPGYTLPRGRDRWYVYGVNGERIADDLFYKTALGALKKVFPGVRVYSSGVGGAGTVSYAIDKEPRHVFVSPDPDFDLRRKSNPLTRVRVNSPPQRPAGNSDTPSPRLKSRRRKTTKAPKGVYANPVDVGDMRDASSYERATRAKLDARLAELSKLIKAPAYPASGSLILEKNAGGFRLTQITSGTAERDLSERMNMGQMLTYLDGALMVARAVR